MTDYKIIGNFDPHEEKMFTVLSKDGSTNEFDPKLEKDVLIRIYTNMVRSRTLDNKAFKLQRSGQMGTFAQALGQEGCQAPVSEIIKDEDWVVPAFREQCLLVSRGIPMAHFYRYYMGHESGNVTQGNILPVSIVVGAHNTHAMGIAWAAKIKKENITVFSYCGDGATSEGAFHEALNFAGVFKTPNVFMVQNNQYAISLKREDQTASKTIAQKSCAYGFPGILVDGNDPLAVYVAVKEAKQYTRDGNGPILIEFKTYRLGPHTTSDDPTLYRSNEEVQEAQKNDPIVRFEEYLRKVNVLNDAKKELIQDEANKEVENAVKIAKETKPNIEDIFKYTYDKLTPQLEEQLEYLKSFQNKGGQE